MFSTIYRRYGRSPIISISGAKPFPFLPLRVIRYSPPKIRKVIRSPAMILAGDMRSLPPKSAERLASAFTGENKFMAAISSAEERIYGEAENTPAALQILLAPLANLSALFGGSERISPANIIAGLLIPDHTPDYKKN